MGVEWEDVRVASEKEPHHDSVILAVFENRRAAEHMVASLGHGFAKKHRAGDADALVIRGNKDGSLRVTQSRVLSASGVLNLAMHISLSLAIGFLGMFSWLKGGKRTLKARREHGSHVGADEHKGHEMLARAGPDAAILLVTCHDRETRKAVAAQAHHAHESWSGSRKSFLAGLEPGGKDDFVRAALDERS